MNEYKLREKIERERRKKIFWIASKYTLISYNSILITVYFNWEFKIEKKKTTIEPQNEGKKWKKKLFFFLQFEVC